MILPSDNPSRKPLHIQLRGFNRFNEVIREKKNTVHKA